VKRSFTDTTTRAPRSPKIVSSSGNADLISTSAPSPRDPKQHSASVTARPPSLTSCADKIARSLASFTKQSMSRFSPARSIAGGCPLPDPESSWRIRWTRIPRHPQPHDSRRLCRRIQQQNRVAFILKC